MQSRRRFIQQTALAAGSLLTSKSVLANIAASPSEISKLTILHTNDVHSRIEPFPMDGGKNQGLGGVAARAELITKIRSEQKNWSPYDGDGFNEAVDNNVLLLDAGDIFQGTPYFNLYKGEPEIKAMTAMGYEAATIGNHDFDAGLENLATQLLHAKFPILICNYDFKETPMEFKTQPYKVFKKGSLKIGVTGVGIEPKGLIPDVLAGKTKYLNPIENLNSTANMLKKDMGCDMVICLSHLGYSYKENSNKICDVILAKETENIDLIIGGHTHTFLDAPVVEKNKIGSEVLINQVGFAGIILGRLDFEFTKQSKKNLTKSHTLSVGKK